jgi:hypothetical protein
MFWNKKRKNDKAEDAAVEIKETVENAAEQLGDDAADAAEIAVLTLVPKSMLKLATTLSLAMKPEISDVQTLQSPRPIGAMIGDMAPAMAASMLSCWSATMFMLKLKLWRNQMMMVAIRMTEQALCRKSFALSQSSRSTFLAPGNR